MQTALPSYTVLSGGVGGAKLVLGLQRVLRNEQLQVIANTGDDFEHLGLTICPDIDTLMYTLGGIAHQANGWGLQNESWQFMAGMEKLGGETWFRLGDGDLATHVRRQQLLTSGLNLSEVTATLGRSLGVNITLCPMSDAPVRTIIETDEGALSFQDYFVRRKTEPVASAFRYSGSEQARASATALAALEDAASGAIIITPSNPWLSIDPIMSLSDIKTTIKASRAPVIGISPIVGGRSLKGPTAKLMRELGIEPSVLNIAEHYRDVLNGLIIDSQDAEYRNAIEAMGIAVKVCNTLMMNLSDKIQLAEDTLNFAVHLRTEKNI